MARTDQGRGTLMEKRGETTVRTRVTSLCDEHEKARGPHAGRHDRGSCTDAPRCPFSQVYVPALKMLLVNLNGASLADRWPA